MEKEYLPGLMVSLTKVITKMIRSMDMGNLSGLMEESMTECGTMDYNMEKVCLLIGVVFAKNTTGVMVKRAA